MKRGKTFLAALTAACLLLGLLPGTALAADGVVSRGTLDLTADFVDYMTKGNIQVAIAPTTASVDDSAEGWSWDHDKKVLTLSGAEIKTNKAAGIKLPAGATLRLEEGTVSTVTIGDTATQSSDDTYGVTCAGDLTIDGGGTLNVDNRFPSQKNSYGIHAGGALTIAGKAVVAATANMGESSYGIYGKAGVTVSGTANVTASGGVAEQRSHGIFADGSQNVEISGTANVTASGGRVTKQTRDGYNKGSAGIQAYQGDVIVSGGTVKATGGASTSDEGNSYGISSDRGNVTISGSAQVEAEGGTGGKSSTGIDAGKNITVSGVGTSVTARGGDAGSETNGGSSQGMFSNQELNITDAVVRATGGTVQGDDSLSMGIRTFDGAIGLSGTANVTATGGTAVKQSMGIYSLKGSLTLSDDAYAVVKSVGAMNSYGIYVGEQSSTAELNILGRARLEAQSSTATGDSSGVFVRGNMTVSSSGAVTAIGGTAGGNSYGLNVYRNSEDNPSTLTISDTGTVTATGGVTANGKSSGIRTIIAKIEGGTVKASGEMVQSKDGYGIDASSGVDGPRIEITGGKVEATGKKGGLSRVPDTLTGCVLVGQKAQGGDWELVIKNAKDYLYTETKPPVARIELIGADTDITIHPGEDYRFSADTVFEDDSTLPSLVTWSLQLNSRAKGTAIDGNGLLTVAADETATEIAVTATSKADSSKSDTVTVTVSQGAPDVTEVALEPKNVKVQRGGTQKFDATVKYSDGSDEKNNSLVSWTVANNADPATNIDENGLLTVAADETAAQLAVTATSRNGSKSDTATVTVKAPTPAPVVTKVEIAPETIEVRRGENQQFNATVKYSDGSDQKNNSLVSWSVTGKQDLATTIDASGLLTVAEGETATQLTVTATLTTDTNISATATVTVKAPTPAPTVTKVEIAPETIEVRRGENQQFDATVTYSNGTTQKDNSLVSWSVTNNADPATVIDTNGLLTVAAGETAAQLTVTAVSKADMSKSATATVKVPQPTPAPTVAGVYLTPASATVRTGGTQQFNAAIRLQDDTYLRDNSLVRWTVTGNSHGGTTVTSGGLLIVAAGETAPTVTVTAQSIADASIAASAMVSVYRPETGAPSDDESVGSEKYYNIAVSAGRGGGISPSGEVRVRQNDGQQLRILPDPGYEIYDVLVDGKSVGALSRYTFTTMRGDHTIEALFVPSFTDVAENAWYRQAVRYAAYNGIFGGTGQGRFSPDLEMSRAMLATVLYRMAGSPALTGAALNAPFTDIDADGWYGPAVRWAWARDVVNGVGKNSFRPNDPVTREQFVTMLYRYAGQPASGGSLSGFPDADQAEAWAADALKWAVERGLLSGKDGGRLDPKGRATRAEAATILMRYLKET